MPTGLLIHNEDDEELVGTPGDDTLIGGAGTLLVGLNRSGFVGGSNS
jgi:hypothetical protein